MVTVRVKVCRVKLAVTERSPVTVRVHGPVPEQAPDHPEKAEPTAGVAVRVTEVPVVKLAEQVLPQLMSEGELVTVPAPLPALVTAKSKLWEGGCVPIGVFMSV